MLLVLQVLLRAVSLVGNRVIACRRASQLSEAKAAPLQPLAEHKQHCGNVAKTLCFHARARHKKAAGRRSNSSPGRLRIAMAGLRPAIRYGCACLRALVCT